MATLLKILVVVCVVGIAVVVGIVLLYDSTSGEAPAESPPISIAPGFETDPGQSTVPEPSATVPDPSPSGATSSAFWIEELSAECEPHDDFAVSALPLGADWRTTERGVYSNSPVLITCHTGGSAHDLSYQWSADFGEIQGSGDRIVWVAPAHGARAHVSVVVTDGTGTAQSAQLVFRVATCDCVFDRF